MCIDDEEEAELSKCGASKSAAFLLLLSYMFLHFVNSGASSRMEERL